MSNKDTGYLPMDSDYVKDQVAKQLEAEKNLKKKLVASELKFVPVVGERSRIYLFDKSELKIHNVVKLCVRPSGNHRLEDKDGGKYIVAAGWLGIVIDSDKWDF